MNTHILIYRFTDEGRNEDEQLMGISLAAVIILDITWLYICKSADNDQLTHVVVTRIIMHIHVCILCTVYYYMYIY